MHGSASHAPRYFFDPRKCNDHQAHLAVLWRSVWLSRNHGDLCDSSPFPGVVHRHPPPPPPAKPAYGMAVSDHHSVLDQPADPYFRHSGMLRNNVTINNRLMCWAGSTKPIRMFSPDFAVCWDGHVFIAADGAAELYARWTNGFPSGSKAGYDLYASRIAVLRPCESGRWSSRVYRSSIPCVHTPRSGLT